MRRNRQQLSTSEVNVILNEGSHGILSCLGDDDYPYAVPLNYVYREGKLYMHSAKNGHKVDAILRQPKVSFTVVGEERIVSKEYTTYFSSVIAFGKARLATDEEYKRAFLSLVDKYAADQPLEKRIKEVEHCRQAIIIAIDIDHITGKQAKELIGTTSAQHSFIP